MQTHIFPWLLIPPSRNKLCVFASFRFRTIYNIIEGFRGNANPSSKQLPWLVLPFVSNSSPLKFTFKNCTKKEKVFPALAHSLTAATFQKHLNLCFHRTIIKLLHSHTQTREKEKIPNVSTWIQSSSLFLSLLVGVKNGRPLIWRKINPAGLALSSTSLNRPTCCQSNHNRQWLTPVQDNNWK